MNPKSRIPEKVSLDEGEAQEVALEGNLQATVGLNVLLHFKMKKPKKERRKKKKNTNPKLNNYVSFSKHFDGSTWGAQ